MDATSKLRGSFTTALRRLEPEAMFWIACLLYLGFSDFSAGDHASLCPFRWIGIDFCPGCGIGRSISLLFHGELTASFAAHPLGGFALIVLTIRILSLLIRAFPRLAIKMRLLKKGNINASLSLPRKRESININ